MRLEEALRENEKLRQENTALRAENTQAWTMERLRDHDAPPPQWLAELLPLPP